MDSSHLTEWEREKEKETFVNTYDEQMRRINEAKTNTLKFVSTKILNDRNEEIENPVHKEEAEISKELSETQKPMTEEQRAASENKYGKLTRAEYEWKPNPTVCKRFNCPNPYPK